jgi:hypothetical protein
VHRRTAALAVLVAALSLALPTAVLAAGATLRDPADGVVDGARDLHLRVTRDPFEAITAIDVGLRRGDAPVEGSRQLRLCESLGECPNRERSADYRIPFDPRTGAPFLPEDVARILPNGVHELRVAIQVGRDVQVRDLELVLSVPPTAPSEVRATVEDEVVALQWTRAPEPDVAGYRVERAGEQGSWSSVAVLAPSAASYADEPGAGTHRYRVVSLRPNGQGGTYEVTSRDTDVTVAARAADTAAGDAGDEGGDPGRGDPDGGSRDDRTGEGAGDDDLDGDPNDDDAEGDAAEDGRGPGSSATRTARTGLTAPSFERGGARTPSLPWDDPDFFQETLDYDDPVAAGSAGDRGDGEVRLSVPGVGALTGGIDGTRAAVPVAGGLLMTAIGLHLWRWLKVPLP